MTKIPVAGTDRPYSSHEIQARFGRMPTKQERQAFSRWRSWNPDVPLSEEDARQRAAREAEAAAQHARLTPVETAMFDLENEIGWDAAEKVKALIEALIAEQHE